MTEYGRMDGGGCEAECIRRDRRGQGKERLDVILVNRGYAGSRARAKEMILAGDVYVDGQKACKAGALYEKDTPEIQILGRQLTYVSRGGLKLEKAVEEWGLKLEGMVCMDIGASTGGFTDCMLQHGAVKVYSVDVGRDQLAEKLRRDERVICMEQTNFRYMTRADIQEEPDFAGADVSFISLTKVLIPARNLLKRGGHMVCLVKPQFEAGRGRVGKNGVVKDPGIHREVIGRIVEYAEIIGFRVLHLGFSPIRGPEGNIEYLLHLEKKEQAEPLSEEEALNAAAELWKERSGLSHTPIWGKRIAEAVDAAWKAL